MRPGGHRWPHPRYSPFETHIGRLITETGGFQVKQGADKGTLEM